MMWVSLALAGRTALFIGADDGGPARERLRYAVSDAEAVQAVLTDLGGIDGSTLLRNPTRTDLQVALADLHDRARDEEVVVYYSGHSDRDGLLLADGRFDWTEFRAAIDGLASPMVLTVVDGCASGSLVRAKGGTLVDPFLQARPAVEGRAWLTSSTADELSQEADRLGASFFTHALVSGLRGAADVDANGQVTLREVHAYASAETSAQTASSRLGIQHPTYALDLAGEGDVVLTELARNRSPLVLAPDIAGRIYVRDGLGRLAAEVVKERGRAASLALPPGTYSVLVDHRQTLAETRVRVANGPTTVEPGHLVPIDGEVTFARGQVYARVPVAVAFMPYPTSEGLDARDQLHHVSLGVVAVYAAQLRGLGLGTVATTYRDGADGAQLAFAYNHAGGRARVAQLTFGVNTATRSLEGLQFGSVNLARRNRGIQLGLANGTPVNEGLSVGLLHVGRRSPGAVFALLPLIREGIHELAVSVGSLQPVQLDAHLGGDRTFTTYTLGWTPFTGMTRASFGFGVRSVVDLEVLAGLGGGAQRMVFVPEARMTLARRVGPLSVFGRIGVFGERPLESGSETVAWLPVAVRRGRWSFGPTVAVGARIGSSR